MKWGEAYSGDLFKFSWKIADFVISGKRLQQPSDMNDDIYKLITHSWQQEPHERMNIISIIQKLESLL